MQCSSKYLLFITNCDLSLKPRNILFPKTIEHQMLRIPYLKLLWFKLSAIQLIACLWANTKLNPYCKGIKSTNYTTKPRYEH